MLVRVVLPTEEGPGPREVADPNLVPSSFKTCGSAGHLVWKSAALADLDGFTNALVKQGQEGKRPATETRHKKNRSEAVHHTDTHTHTHTHTHTFSLR